MIVFAGDSWHSERLKQEFEDEIDKRLQFILFAFAKRLEYRKEGTLVITHLIRTQKEQDAIYTSEKMDPKIRKQYLAHPFFSVHQFGRGADIGVADIKNPEKEMEWLNERISYNGDLDKPTAILENLGFGRHIHIQVTGLSIGVMGTILK